VFPDAVAVTGAEGFIGSHLVEALVRTGHRVRAMVLYEHRGSLGCLQQLERDVLASVEVQFGDVRDQESVLSLMRGAGTVYHLAALVGIRQSYRTPRPYVETNLFGTLNVMDAARALGTARVVHASTGEVYGTAYNLAIDEGHPLHPRSPYAASKIAADKLAESYYWSFGVPVVVLRPFNTFGPRQSGRAIIPTVISQAVAGTRRIRLGALKPVRDFNYVSDIVSAFILAAMSPVALVAGQVLNAGTGRGVSIVELVSAVGRVMGLDLDVAPEPRRLRPARSEVMQLVADSAKIKALTGWAPRYTLEEGLSLTAPWFSRTPGADERDQPELSAH